MLILPFPYLSTLFAALSDILEGGGDCEVSSKAACFLLRIHQGQIIHTDSMSQSLRKLRDSTSKVLDEAQVGTNSRQVPPREFNFSSIITKVPPLFPYD